MPGINLDRFKRKQSQDWLDWLQDDPAPTGVRNRMRERAVRDASRPVVRSVGERPQVTTAAPQAQPAPDKTGSNQVSIHIHLPDVTGVRNRLKAGYLASKQYVVRRKRIAAGISVVAIIGASAFGIVEYRKNAQAPTPGDTEVLSQNIEKPTFEYSLPDEGEKGLDGPARFNAERKVVSFQDSIGSTAITVSQQPLPAGFETDTDNKVKKLAEEFSAKDVLVNANPTAYLGTDEKGPQTVIFSKKNLLVFIQSTKQIDKNDWAEYITSLQ
jgi:hypothetical protein